jgi:hypothetical protein
MQLSDSHPSSESLLAICLFAAFADGDKSDEERGHIESLARELGGGDVSAVSRRVLMGRLSVDVAVAELKTREDRMLAYELARAVCEAGGSISGDASTSAIGNLAVKYYAGGRKLGGGEIKSLHGSLVNEASQLHAKYLPEIQQRAQTLNPTTILNLVRGKVAV